VPKRLPDAVYLVTAAAGVFAVNNVASLAAIRLTLALV
jgi:hypothetical protein